MASFSESANLELPSLLQPLQTILVLRFEDGHELVTFYVQPLTFSFLSRWELYQLYLLNVELNAGTLYEGPQFGYFGVIQMMYEDLISDQVVIFIPLEDIEVVGPLNFNHFSLLVRFE